MKDWRLVTMADVLKVIEDVIKKGDASIAETFCASLDYSYPDEASPVFDALTELQHVTLLFEEGMEDRSWYARQLHRITPPGGGVSFAGDVLFS